jgi:hypothetical protein
VKGRGFKNSTNKKEKPSDSLAWFFCLCCYYSCLTVYASSSKHFLQLFISALLLNKRVPSLSSHSTKQSLSLSWVEMDLAPPPFLLAYWNSVVSFIHREGMFGQNEQIPLYLTDSCATAFVLKTASHPEVLWARPSNGRQRRGPLTHIFTDLRPLGKLVRDPCLKTEMCENCMEFPQNLLPPSLKVFSGTKEFNLGKRNYLFKLTNIYFS